MSKRFETINDVLEDQNFQTILNKNVLAIIHKRETRPAPKTGFKFKRDWYDRLKETETFNTNFITENIKYVLEKTSNLGRVARINPL